MSERLPLDWQERQRALNINGSYIVQAPAGSGKTELLVQRILSLLAVAENPEEILSITFTRKAAAEMRLRLLEAMEKSHDCKAPEESHARETWQRGRAVLARDAEKGWGLLTNPSRLQMMTIDGFCSQLTRRMPWLARFGEQPGVTDHPIELYMRAAENLLKRLERGGEGNHCIEVLLGHLDNRLKLLRDLLVSMLGKRDQWLRHLMPRRHEQARALLESGLRQFVVEYLEYVCTLLGDESYEELWSLALYAAENLERLNPEHPLVSLLQSERDLKTQAQWRILAELLMTSSGKLRRSVNKTTGFPADKSDKAQQAKSRMLALLEKISRCDSTKAAIKGIQQLPDESYSQSQWSILESLIELLPLAVVELQEVFRQEGQVDFVEVAGAARSALGSTLSPEDLLLQLDSRIRHILVDEFQDTSYTQYDLLRVLTEGWEPGDGRTLFLVGDPMQSIYRFREADVGLFLRVCQQGIRDLPVTPIVLNTNFRSTKPMVEWVNESFKGLFPSVEDELTGAVSFANSHPFKQVGGENCVNVHLYQDRQDSAEAERVVDLVQQARRDSPNDSIAILVRSRSHLEAIIPALKKAGLSYQAQDVDCLTDRPVVQDILSIVRAMQHMADRIAWLAVLRAPWCGLSLDDLLHLCGGKPGQTIWQLLVEPDIQTEMFDNISFDGRKRLSRIVPVLGKALSSRGRLSVRRLVESTWISLGGPACVSETDLLDVEQVFGLLEEFHPDDTIEELEERLNQLYAAPDPQAGPELQLMTIHKAKGLEFDTVILPGLGRGVRSEEKTLLRWLEHPDYELLLAPIPSLAGDEGGSTYDAIGNIQKLKSDHETLRLLYVAVTRARSNLHLLGHAKLDTAGDLVPTSRSLLSVLWSSCRDAFSASVGTGNSENPSKKLKTTLIRLPEDWCPPKIESSPYARTSQIVTASDGGHYHKESFSSRLQDEGSVVGTIVHEWLERIAVEGLDTWQIKRVESLREHLGYQLSTNGIPAKRVTQCLKRIEKCLVTVLDSERGRWLLSAHQAAECELAINGIVENNLVRAVIDRTFIDNEGVRWVVDYKTSSPSEGESWEVFLSNEMIRYQGQLYTYSYLIGALNPDQNVRAALYFPMIDAWIECPV